MRALIYSDAQATDGHERCFNDPSKPLQLWRIEHLYDELERIYRKYRCDALWDLGDTTDDRNAIPVTVIDLLCERLEAFAGDHNFKLVGNHEQFLRDTRIHAGKMFRHVFRVVDQAEIIKLENVNLVCLSYDDQVERTVRFLEKAAGHGSAIVIGHFQVAGCQMSSGVALSGVPLKALEFAELGLLGHVHKPQTLGNGNVHYVGSPFQQHWGESGENKRVAVLDLQPDDLRLTWVPLEGFPVYRQVGFEEFVASVQEDSEDRYKVILNSVEQTEKFYAHPLANHADEAVFAFEQPGASGDTELDRQIPRSKRDILLRYMQKNAPENFGVTLDAESMVEFGERITLCQ